MDGGYVAPPLALACVVMINVISFVFVFVFAFLFVFVFVFVFKFVFVIHTYFTRYWYDAQHCVYRESCGFPSLGRGLYLYLYLNLYRVVFLTGLPDFQFQNEKTCSANEELSYIENFVKN